MYFYDGVAPENITVIGTRHYQQDQYMPYPDAAYRYINHNRKDIGYESFSVEYLKRRYESYLSPDTIINKDNRDWPELYEKMIDKSSGMCGTIQKHSVLNDLTGFWVYLQPYGKEYYLDQRWDFIQSFRILENCIDFLYMDGPYPYLIKSVEAGENSEIVISTQNYQNEEEFVFKLIDKKRKIYDFLGSYVTPASNSSNFELIQYANRSGDLIIPFGF